MTNKEAIEFLTSCFIDVNYARGNGRSYPTQRMHEALLMALEALKKEPKTVIDVSDGYADGCDVFDAAECPACGFYFESCDNIWGEPYCPHCGQALKWEIEQ